MTSSFIELSTEVLCILENQYHNKEDRQLIRQILKERCEQTSMLTLCNLCYKDQFPLLTQIAAETLGEKILVETIPMEDQLLGILGKDKYLLFKLMLTEEKLCSLLKTRRSTTPQLIELFGFQTALSHMSTSMIIKISYLRRSDMVPELAEEEMHRRFSAQQIAIPEEDDTQMKLIKRKRKGESKDEKHKGR